jgi:hypothetical protein
MPRDDIYKDGQKTQFSSENQPERRGNIRGTEHSSTRLKRLLHAIQKAKNPVTKTDEEFTTLELMDAALMAKALKGDVAAYREILDRLEGKAVQKTEIAGSLNVTADVGSLSPERAAELRALLRPNGPDAETTD